MRGLSQSVQPNSDTFYKDKLKDLAESYKKFNLDFSDVQEDDMESDQNAGATSYNIAKSVLNEGGDTSESCEALERHLEELHYSRGGQQI